MPRVGRFKYNEDDAWYHLCSRVAAHKGVYPLSDPVPMQRLIKIIEHFSSIYYCEVAAFCVMGSHYHLIAQFAVQRPVCREELREKTRLMYPSRAAQAEVDVWSEEKWEHYRRRLFNVSEFMRNVQATFARWYNFNYQRRGHFWADRFKSVYLQNERTVLDCMMYVELNPVRAGLVQRPEEWRGSSLFLREIGRDGWLAPLKDLLEQPTGKKALREYRERLYYRGNVPTKPGQKAISQAVLDQEIARGFASRGMYRKRLGFFIDGLAIGSEVFIRDQLARLREEGQYLRRKHPIPQLGGIHVSLRGQRKTAETF